MTLFGAINFHPSQCLLPDVLSLIFVDGNSQVSGIAKFYYHVPNFCAKIINTNSTQDWFQD